MIQAGLLIPQGNPSLEDLVTTRTCTIVALNIVPGTKFCKCRRNIGDRCFLEYTHKGRAILRPLFLSAPDILQRLQVPRICSLTPSRVNISSFKWNSTVIPPSPRQYPLQGLNLIRLLTQNRIADFHTTLESLPADALNDNAFITHPVNLERWLMEGSYSKVWSAREEAPAEEYKFFVDSLMGTIRFDFLDHVNNSATNFTFTIICQEMRLLAAKKPLMRAYQSQMRPLYYSSLRQTT